ncbi:MAG: LysM peptidoglycan-binding domain-containing protein [Lentimicrobiaceae bacterium]|jgi:uncharacterized protein involved in exopolysaccharide biosynthesis/LysM repeat protein|nr:LysM peptidoglycan-binding domain-containing protein [Lentimicrobiaceae bacterium]
MDLVQFFRIIKKNLLLLIAIPLLLALIVFYFVRTQSKVYESEALIYTGITTGYSIESTAYQATDFFNMSAQFDNMINIILSRQTIVESSIMLLAQDLCLEAENPQYISKDNYEALQHFIPKRIKDLVVKHGKAGIEREKEEQIRSLEKEIKSLEKEISKKKTIAAGQTSYQPDHSESPGLEKHTAVSNNSERKIHLVKSGETLLSIANLYGTTLNKLLEINNLSTSNVSIGQQIVISETDESTYASNKETKVSGLYDDENEFDYEDEYFVGTVTDGFGSTTTYTIASTHAQDYVYEKDPIVPPGIIPADYYKTVQNLRNYYNSSDTNFIYKLLHYGASPHYSISALQSIQIHRISNSDLVRLIYTSDDPGICQQTLKIISSVFVKAYKELRVNQTNMVVAYFQRQVDSAEMLLKNAEDRLLMFNKKNNIINYQEQTKYIAEQKEELDLYYQNEQIRMAQATASLRELETKLTRKDSIYLKSDLINQKRKEFADISERILINELAEDYDSRIGNEIAILRKQEEKLRDEIKLYVDQLYLYSHSTQGIPINTLLTEWLTNALNYEQAKASLVVLSRRKMDFVKTYQRFAPLGAMLKRIEREIQITEQTYLQLLNSLNMARMRQQNIQMTTNIRIVDPPYFPIQARSSKTKLIVLAAFVIGFFMVLFVILVLEYFDSSMRNPEKTAKIIGGKIAGVYPLITSDSQKAKLNPICNRLIDIIIQNIKLSIKNDSLYPVQKPYFILFFSTTDETGKTMLMNRIANKMRLQGEHVFTLNYKEEANVDEEIDDNNLNYTYNIGDDFANISSLQQLLSNAGLRKENYAYDFIFLEIPSILHNSYPIGLLQDVDASILILKSSDRWRKADANGLEMIEEIIQKEPLIIINEAEDFAIQEFISDVKIEQDSSLWARTKRIITYPSRIRVVHVKDEKEEKE